MLLLEWHAPNAYRLFVKVPIRLDSHRLYSLTKPVPSFPNLCNYELCDDIFLAPVVLVDAFIYSLQAFLEINKHHFPRQQHWMPKTTSEETGHIIKAQQNWKTCILGNRCRVWMFMYLIEHCSVKIERVYICLQTTQRHGDWNLYVVRCLS